MNVTTRGHLHTACWVPRPVICTKGPAGQSMWTPGPDLEDHVHMTLPPLHHKTRPFSPFPGCAVCWDEGDEPHTLICDGCDIERHMYCLPVPLEEVPEV